MLYNFYLHVSQTEIFKLLSCVVLCLQMNNTLLCCSADSDCSLVPPIALVGDCCAILDPEALLVAVEVGVVQVGERALHAINLQRADNARIGDGEDHIRLCGAAILERNLDLGNALLHRGGLLDRE